MLYKSLWKLKTYLLSCVIFILVNEDYVYIGAKDTHRDGEFTWITSGRHAASYSYPGAILGFHNSRTCASFHHGRLHAGDCSDKLKPLCQAPMK